MIKQLSIQVSIPIWFLKVGNMPPILVMIFIRIPVPNHPELTPRRYSSQQPELHKVTDIACIPILQ